MSQVDRRSSGSRIGRRSFLKMAALSSAVGAGGVIASANVTRDATDEEIKNPYPNAKKEDAYFVYTLSIGLLNMINSKVQA